MMDNLFDFTASSGGREFSGTIEVLEIHNDSTGGAGADLEQNDVVGIVLMHLETIPGFSWDLHIAREADPSDGLTFTSAFLSGDDDPLVVVARVQLESWITGECQNGIENIETN